MTDTKVVSEVPECFKMRGEFVEEGMREKYELILKTLKEAYQAYCVYRHGIEDSGRRDHEIIYRAGRLIEETLKQIES